MYTYQTDLSKTLHIRGFLGCAAACPIVLDVTAYSSHNRRSCATRAASCGNGQGSSAYTGCWTVWEHQQGRVANRRNGRRGKSIFITIFVISPERDTCLSKCERSCSTSPNKSTHAVLPGGLRSCYSSRRYDESTVRCSTSLSSLEAHLAHFSSLAEHFCGWYQKKLSV